MKGACAYINVLQNEDYAAIGRELGIEMTVYSNGEDSTGFIDSSSEYFKLISSARVKNISIEDEYNTNMYSENLDFEIVKILEDEVFNRKDAFKMADFTDMIERFIIFSLFYD